MRRGLTSAALVLGLLALPGCASAPIALPSPGAAPSSAVQLVGPRGPLSAAQSQAVLERLQKRGTPTDIFERHLAIEEAVADGPLTVGNDAVLLQDGPATYRAMFAAIDAARDHINMETYIFDDDEVGQRFAQALMNKQRQGVAVHLIRDSVGTLGTPGAFFQTLVDSGVKVLEFNPVNPLLARRGWELNQRDHRKLLIVDGQVAFLGGINVSSVYSGGSFRQRRGSSAEPAWRDTHLQLRGPVVAELQKMFLATWAQQQGAELPLRRYLPPPQQAGSLVVRAIGSSPTAPYSQIYATLLSALASAETSVLLTNAYFAPDPQLLLALEAAAARGVDVKLILPSQTDNWLVFHAGRSHYERLLQAGVKIFERSGVILHSKTALIDGVWSTVGSTNLDWRSFVHNHELDAVVLGAAFGAQVRAMFERDLAASQAIDLATWQRRALALRAKELFARAWEYWL